MAKKRKGSKRGKTKPAAKRRSPALVGTLAAAALAVAVIALLGPLSGGGDPELEPVTPQVTEGMDPLVSKIIAEHVERAEADPSSARAHGTLGLVYAANDLWAEARASFENAARLAPEDFHWRFQGAIAARRSGDAETALEELRELAAQEPRFAPAHQRLGEALYEAGELAAAEAAYRRVLELEPNQPDGYAGTAQILLARGENAEAAELLERAVALDPNHGMAHYLLGRAYLGQGREDEARRHLKRGEGAQRRYLIDPLSDEMSRYAVGVTAQLARAGRLLQGGDVAGALAVLEKAREDRPENVRILNNLAVAQQRAGQVEEAHRTLLEARRLDPDDFATEMNLATCVLRLGRPAEALRHAEAAVARAPEVGQAHVARALALERLNRPDEAVAAGREALRLDAGDPRSHLFMAGLLMRLERLDEALGEFEIAGRELAGPEALQAQLGRFQAASSLGRDDVAAQALAAAREIDPGNPQIAALERQLGAGR